MLEKDGLEVTLDQWDLKPGDELALYMEKAITESDYVLVVCSEGYKRKADNRLGGSGYEAKLIATNISMNQHIKKFIPIYVGGDWNDVAPEFIKGNLYVDLSHPISSESFELNYTDLLTTICNVVRKKQDKVDVRERIANRLGLAKEEVEFKEDDMAIKIIGIITDEVTIPKNDGSRGSALYSIPFRLNRRPEHEWCELFINSWNSPPRFTTMHRPGIARVIGNTIVLNGTSIEDVKQYHRETLILAVEVANNKLKQNNMRKQAIMDQQRKREEDHFDNLNKHINEIEF